MAPEDQRFVVVELPVRLVAGGPVEHFDHLRPEGEHELRRGGIGLLQEGVGLSAVAFKAGDICPEVFGGRIAGHLAEIRGLFKKSAVEVEQGCLEDGLLRQLALQGLCE